MANTVKEQRRKENKTARKDSAAMQKNRERFTEGGPVPVNIKDIKLVNKKK